MFAETGASACVSAPPSNSRSKQNIASPSFVSLLRVPTTSYWIGAPGSTVIVVFPPLWILMFNSGPAGNCAA